MNEHTPTAEDVKDSYIFVHRGSDKAEEEFDRWLKAVRQESFLEGVWWGTEKTVQDLKKEK